MGFGIAARKGDSTGRGEDAGCGVQGSFNARISQDLHQRAALYAVEHGSQAECGGAVGAEGVSDARGIVWLESHISEARCGAPGRLSHL